MAANENEIVCTAQRHMDVEFFTYNAMLATAKAGQKKRTAEGKPPGDLIFSGTLFNLGNKINRSKEQTGKAVERLERVGWLVLIQEQRRTQRGNWSTIEYRVVEHEEFSRTHSCPPPLYDAKGNRLKPAETPAHIRRLNEARFMGVSTSAPKPQESAWTLGPPIVWEPGTSDATKWVLDVVARVRKVTDTGNPVPVTATGNPVPEPTPQQETLCPPQQETLCPTATGNPVPTATGNPVTRFALESALDLPAKPCLPANTGGRGSARVSHDDAKSETQQWEEFIKANREELPESLQFCKPFPNQLGALLGRIKTTGADSFCERVYEFDELRQPSLGTRHTDRWGVVLAECTF